MVFYLLLLPVNEVQHRCQSDLMNLYDNIIQKTQEQPNDAALVYFGFPITYGRLGALIDQTASGLQHLGIGCGNTVSIALPSSPESIALFYALNKLGVIVCTTDVRYIAEHVAAIVNNTRSKLLFIMSFNLKSIAKKTSEMRIKRIVVMRGCEIFPRKMVIWYTLGERFNGRKRAFRSDKCFMSWDELVGATNNNQEATDNLIRKHDDGLMWIHTGDTGRLDNNGDLYVVERKKRMIVRYDGSKVFPIEIETVLLKCPDVKSFAVVGATDAAHNQSGVPVAYVVASSGHSSEKKIQKYCKQNLPVYFQPEKILFLKELPTTHISKVNYAKLSEMSTTV